MSFSFNLKKIMIGAGVVAVLVGLFFVHAVGGLASSDVEFVQPPAFVAQYVADKYGSDNSTGEESPGNLTKDYFKEATLVRDVILNGESPDELIRLFTSPDKATRVKIAFAFSDVNLKLSHDEGSNFDERRDEFWEKVKDHETAMRNATFEALIVSAQERTRSFIPYTLAWWMLDDKPKTVDMLFWAAKHHPDSWVRRFSVFYVVQFGENEALADALIDDRTHDPAFRVRSEVLRQRYRLFNEMIFGKEE